MPTTPSPAQSEASRLNGAHSTGPATADGKARSALNGVRHGLCGRTFFLLPDEDPAEFQEHEAMWLAVWSPRDLHEHEAAEAGHPRHVARDPRRPAGGAGADRPVRRRRDRGRGRAAGGQGRGHEGPGHAPALPGAHRARASRRHGRPRRPAATPSRPAITRATTRTRDAAGGRRGAGNPVGQPLGPTRARPVVRPRRRAAEPNPSARSTGTSAARSPPWTPPRRLTSALASPSQRKLPGRPRPAPSLRAVQALASHAVGCSPASRCSLRASCQTSRAASAFIAKMPRPTIRSGQAERVTAVTRPAATIAMFA